MKRYKLKKDLPLYKAGTKFRVSAHGNLCVASKVVYTKEDLENNPTILKDWFEEIPKQQKMVEDLEKGDVYYYICSSGSVLDDRWLGSIFDRDRAAIGNCYLTREEAEKKLEWCKARQILQQDTKGFKPNWCNPHEDRFIVVFSLFCGERDKSHCGYLDTHYSHYSITSEIYFATQADAKDSIKAHAKEWKIYLGVEE